jgi:hypothetical protein
MSSTGASTASRSSASRWKATRAAAPPMAASRVRTNVAAELGRLELRMSNAIYMDANATTPHRAVALAALEAARA